MAKDVLNIECVTKFEAKSGEDYDRLTSLAIAGEDLPDFLYVYGNGKGSGLALVKELYENGLIMPRTKSTKPMWTISPELTTPPMAMSFGTALPLMVRSMLCPTPPVTSIPWSGSVPTG